MISLQSLTALLISIVSFFSFLVPSAPKYEPKEADLLMTASVLSDLHIGPRNPILQYNINKAFRNASAAKDGNDALVLLGDNTMDGMEQQYAQVYTSLSMYNKAENLLVAVGNHDIWASGGYHKAKERFIGYYNNFSGNTIDNIYYYKVINGYYFIMLGTEADMGTTGFLSQAQLDWLNTVLDEATAQGKPAFVFNHFPISRVYESERLQQILNAYSNVFFITGHMHHALGNGTFKKAGDSLYYVDMPGFNGAEDDIWTYLGHGLQIEAYQNKVILRMRDFIRGEWLADYEYTVDLV